MKDKRSVPDRLKSAAVLYEERNAMYGNAYRSVGYAMHAMFPNGIELTTVKDFNRFGCFHTMVSKMCRYSNTFHLGGHADSMDDISVYAAMIQELDNE